MNFLLRIDRALAGWPEQILTVALVAIGSATILVGLFAPAWLKAAWIAWEVLP